MLPFIEKKDHSFKVPRFFFSTLFASHAALEGRLFKWRQIRCGGFRKKEKKGAY